MSEEKDDVMEGAEAPVAGGQKFRKGGFAPAAEETEAEAAEETEEVTEEVAEAADESDEGAEPKKKKVAKSEDDEDYVIGGKNFKSRKEAFDYAEELERQQLANDAFRQGVEAASKGDGSNPQAEAQAPEGLTEAEMTEFYADPPKFFTRKEKEIEERVLKRVDQVAASRKKHDLTWDEFYREYPDLENSKKLVNVVLSEHWAVLKDVDTKKALRIVAEKARAERKEMLRDLLPSKTLPERRTTTHAGGGGPGETQDKGEEKTLSFVEQMKKNRESRLSN